MAFLARSEESQCITSATLSDSRWLVAQRVIASRNFEKSGRLCTFLAYIVRCVIEERTDEITEQQIGIHVFGRAPGYNPGEDNIVRTTARQLRQRLAVYYLEEGSADELRIEVPRGAYIPVFQPGSKHLSELQSASLDSPSSTSQEPFTRSHDVHAPKKKAAKSWLYAAVLLLAGAALTLVTQKCISAVRLRASANDLLWRQMFSSTLNTIFVPGDAGLNMFNNETHAPDQVSLDDYIGGKYLYSLRAQSPNFAGAPIASRCYVPIADLQFAEHLASLPRFRRVNFRSSFPRDLTPQDFRNVNVILSGAPVYNPWDELFDVRLNFHFVYDGANNSMFVENRHPHTGEPSAYRTDWKRIFGYIALTDNLDNNGKVLLVEGTSLVGVEAAVDFLFNSKMMAPVLDKAKKSNGDLSSFEVLLDATSFGGGDGRVEVLATRFY